ncbi:MFS general substrate transporter [Fistulina hepatica ATCC 64428]|uniref:MFS general substrate transporter n=1 Tax=Fistulina hepatica ATCC 64428 TaxID=1128425 RepID=A0A0D7A8J7_9AGAR|nr:MFS general substrate transporter [Fistulina hepatica ATCC 64428]
MSTSNSTEIEMEPALTKHTNLSQQQVQAKNSIDVQDQISVSSQPPNGSEIERSNLLLSRIHFVASCWTMITAGWNDGTTGPLLPRIQEVYHVNYTIVSLLFVAACIGFIAGAIVNVPLTEKLGFGKVLVLGSALQAIAYAIDAAAPPFPVLCAAYGINGVGMALQDAQANGYVASLKRNPETKMGILHATYGAGALISPLAATQFSQLKHWSFHYLISMSIATFGALLFACVFRFRTHDQCLAAIGQVDEGHQTTEEAAKLSHILRLKTVHLLAFFILVYVGVEAGWIVTFIIKVRGGGASSGYISSGFFGGLMLGRVALLWVNKTVGERRALFMYSLSAIGLELVIWFVPSLYGDAIAVAFVGLLLGPVYPIVMNHSSRILPKWLLTGSIGWIAGFGQAGSAVLPFITGVLAQNTSVKSLQPFLVAMMGLQTALWAMVPSGPRSLRAD